MYKNQSGIKSYYAISYKQSGFSQEQFFFIDEKGDRASDNSPSLDDLLQRINTFKIPRERIMPYPPEDLLLKVNELYSGQTISPVRLNLLETHV